MGSMRISRTLTTAKYQPKEGKPVKHWQGQGSLRDADVQSVLIPQKSCCNVIHEPQVSGTGLCSVERTGPEPNHGALEASGLVWWLVLFNVMSEASSACARRLPRSTIRGPAASQRYVNTGLNHFYFLPPVSVALNPEPCFIHHPNMSSIIRPQYFLTLQLDHTSHPGAWQSAEEKTEYSCL